MNAVFGRIVATAHNGAISYHRTLPRTSSSSSSPSTLGITLMMTMMAALKMHAFAVLVLCAGLRLAEGLSIVVDTLARSWSASAYLASFSQAIMMTL